MITKQQQRDFARTLRYNTNLIEITPRHHDALMDGFVAHSHCGNVGEAQAILAMLTNLHKAKEMELVMKRLEALEQTRDESEEYEDEPKSRWGRGK